VLNKAGQSAEEKKASQAEYDKLKSWLENETSEVYTEAQMAEWRKNNERYWIELNKLR
jgi:hypothetical protein